MNGIHCFVLEDTGRDRVYLRRFNDHGDDPHGPMGYCNASVAIGEEPRLAEIRDATEEERRDPRWPAACSQCGKAFADSDHWQMFRRSLYRGMHPEQGEVLVTLDEAPAGALWRAIWYEPVTEWRGPDGQSWVCMTPGGEWFIDGPSNSNGRWERSGAAPLFTARPSILIPNQDGSERYHGWLTEGVLTPC